MKSFLLVILAVLLNVLAQIFMKFSGSVNANATVLSIFSHLRLFWQLQHMEQALS